MQRKMWVLFADFFGQRTAAVLHRTPFRQREPLHGTKSAAFQTGVAAVEFINQLFDLLALGVAVGRTGVFHHGKFQAFHRVPHQILAAVEQRADLGDLSAVQPGDGLETGQAAFVDQGHEERLDGIIVVVTQSDFVDTSLQHGAVQGTAAHLGAHGAGIFLLTEMKIIWWISLFKMV